MKKNPEDSSGVTLRDYFAAHIGINDLQRINDGESQKALLGEEWSDDWSVEKQVDFNMKMEALLRYRYADAMLTEREKNA